MSHDQENPYASPQSESLGESHPGLESENTLHGLKPCSVILMILLTVVTLGLYINFWVHRTAVALNRKLDRNRISMVVVAMFWVFSLSSVLWTIPEIVSEDDSAILRIGNLLTNVDMIFTLFIAFMIRGRLNMLIQVPRGHAAWFHGLWTFLFGIYYLQWKINRDLRLPKLPVRRSKSTTAPSIEFLPGTSPDKQVT